MRRLAALILMSSLLCGCATKVKLADTDPGFAAALSADPNLALGGVVVSEQVLGELAPDDAVMADEVVFRAFLQHRPDLTVWPREAVDGRLEPDQLEAVRGQATAAGPLPVEAVRAMGEVLQGSRYFVMTRITADQVRTVTEGPTQDRDGFRPGAEGVPEDGGAWSNPVITERRLELSVDIYDLRDGRSVWQAEASSRARQHYEYEDALRDDATYVKDRLAAEDDEPTLSRTGVYLKTPDLMDLLEQALTKVVQQLPVATS